MTRERDRKALAQVVGEARAERPPALDWSRIERQLAEHAGTPVPRGRRLPVRALLAAALLAGLALVLWARSDHGRPTTEIVAVAATTAPGAGDGDALAVGSALAAADAERAIEHRGRGRWTLAPGARATLVARGPVLAIRLETGSVEVHVVPSSVPESFVVEAADVRVAAHGTTFRVKLATDGVEVGVSEGSVLVGPRARPRTGSLLTSPTSGRFTLGGDVRPPDGAPAAPAEPETREAAFAPAAKAGHTAPAPGSSGATADATDAHAHTALPPPPTPRAINDAARRMVEASSTCFREWTVAGAGVRVTAHTTLSFSALPDGTIAGIQFAPRIAPQVQTCVSREARSMKASTSPHGFRVSRTIDLER